MFPKRTIALSMAVAVVKNSVASGKFRVINSTWPTQTISTSKSALIKLYLTNNFKGGTRHAIDPWNQSKASKILASSSLRVYLAQVNLKSKI
ncbi:hypothetical protein QUA86_23685 [Microcoleus sp. F6_B6]